MQFLVTGYDGTDPEAQKRRSAVKMPHLKLAEQLVLSGKQLYGAAILDESGKTIGSSIVCDFESREALDVWLKEEPYVTGGVWKKIEIHRCELWSPSLK